MLEDIREYKKAFLPELNTCKGVYVSALGYVINEILDEEGAHIL